VDEAGYLISTVVAVKERQFRETPQAAFAAYGKGVPAPLAARAVSRNALVVDAGVNIL
jgi:hypothetical protein